MGDENKVLENEVAMVISIGMKGQIVRATDAEGKKLKPLSAKEREELISSATKSTCHCIPVHQLVVNPCYVMVGPYLKEVSCRRSDGTFGKC